MEIVDLSHPLDPQQMSIYPGDPPLVCSPCATISKDGYSVHNISLGSHTGTHIDAPSHFVENGATIDQVPMSKLVGPALVVDVSHRQAGEAITWEDFDPSARSQMKQGTIVLICTGWSRHWATPSYFSYPYLTKDAARHILSSGVSVIGMDTLSPDQVDGDDFGVHETVLGQGGILAENLNNLDKLLSFHKAENADGGRKGWTVQLFPLNLRGSDGSPVRAIAYA